jgi:hypothetical protein
MNMITQNNLNITYAAPLPHPHRMSALKSKFPQDECIEIKVLSSTYRSTALSSGIVDVKLRPKSIRICQMKIHK